MKNLIIQSDNLAAMQKLLPEYSGKIDVMPIDPPYNTAVPYIGYKDFDAEWLSFMKERLSAAYPLLSDKGVMFIHIDENEFCALYSLCGKIFGAGNVTSLIWKKVNALFDKNRKEKPLKSGIRRTHEFVVVCFKDRQSTALNPVLQPVWNGVEFTQKQKPLETVLDNFGTTSSAKDEIEELLGGRDIFSTPKPVKLIKELIRAASTEKSLVMDFFAGSGTAGHAVMDLNKEDGGNRKFILITNDENGICARVTLPRIKAAIAKYGYNETFEFINQL